MDEWMDGWIYYTKKNGIHSLTACYLVTLDEQFFSTFWDPVKTFLRAKNAL